MPNRFTQKCARFVGIFSQSVGLIYLLYLKPLLIGLCVLFTYNINGMRWDDKNNGVVWYRRLNINLIVYYYPRK